MIEKHEVDYIAWQNKAFSFYLASRLLYEKKLFAPAAFSSQQAIETLMKATLVYWDHAFSPKKAGHDLAKMKKLIGKKVVNGKSLDIPKYFYFEQRYQTVSRYPNEGKGLGLPNNFLEDIDDIIYKLLLLVPFQYNSLLIHALQGKDFAKLKILRKNNKTLRLLRKVWGIKLIQKV